MCLQSGPLARWNGSFCVAWLGWMFQNLPTASVNGHRSKFLTQQQRSLQTA